MPDLDDLKAQRATLSERLAGIVDTSSRLRSATSEESAILGEIGTLGRKEVEAVQRWATDGAQGDMPGPDSAERARLHAALVAAQAKTASIGGAVADLDRQQAEVSAELQRVNAKIEAAALDTLRAEHAAEVEAFEAFVRDQLRPKMARLLALRAWVFDQVREHSTAGRTEQAQRLGQLGEAMSLPPIEIEPTPGEVVFGTGAWGRRFLELTGDKPASNVVPLATGSAAA